MNFGTNIPMVLFTSLDRGNGKNAGVEAKAIVFIHEDAIVKVNVDVMNALETHN